MSVQFVNPYRDDGGGGGGGGSVSITDTTVIEVKGSGVATAGYEVNSDGDVYKFTSTGPVSYETWLLSGVNSDFEVRAQLVSGSLSSGSSALNTWLNLGTLRAWRIDTSFGAKLATLTIQIRDASTLAVLDSCTVNLEAEVS